MATVETILKEKGKAVYSIKPEQTILDALKVMAEKNTGSVLVMDGDKLLGIFTDRDNARRGTLAGNPVTTQIKEVMTRDVYCVKPDQSAEACMALMVDKHFRHLPVVKDSRVIGMVSVIDVVKTVLKDKQALIDGIENYLLGQAHEQ
jgi:CBS domain-containing protein